MSGQAIALDHVGIVGPDLNRLAATYARLGFQLTPLARHEGGRTGNHCIMLAGSYLELVATLPGGTSATLGRFLDRYAGIHILAFRIEDDAAALSRLARAGFPELGVSRTERALDDGDPAGPHVGFALITPPDPPEGRVHLIRHLTPDTLWQKRFQAHPNRVTSLASVTMLVEQPAVTTAWLSRVAGRAAVVEGDGYRLELPRGRVCILPASAHPDLAGGPVDTPPLPWIAGLTVHTDDGNRALRATLAGHDMPHQTDGGAIIVRVGALFLRFEPSLS